MSKKNNKKGANEEQRQKQQLLSMKKLDPTALKEQIHQLKEQLSNLVGQKDTFGQKITVKKEKYMKESFDLQKTIKIQQEQLNDLENNYKLLKNTFEDTRKKLKNEWETETANIQNKRAAQKDQLMKAIKNSIKRNEYLKQFQKREQQYVETLNKLNQKEDYRRMTHEKDIEKIKNEHETKRNQLKDVTSKEIDNIKTTEVTRLQQKMSKQLRLKKENQVIDQEISLCESQKKLLESQFENLLQENNMSHNKNTNSLLQGQASQTYERSLRVIKLENKINKLKEHHQKELTRIQIQSKKTQKEFCDKEKEANERFNKLESWLKIKDKDLKKVKACSQMVLNQRSSLQSYLLEVFNEHQELDYKDPDNINIILRFLFTKINSKKPPVTYKDYILNTEQSGLSKSIF